MNRLPGSPDLRGHAPRDERGRFVPVACPDCGCGSLRAEGSGSWICDGLADPDDADKPLEACTFSHQDGDRYQVRPGLRGST